MKLRSRSAVFAALSLALALASAAPVQAQVGLVGVGRGSYDSFTLPGTTLRFSYFVWGQGNGAATGLAVWRGPNSMTVWQVNSVMTLPNSTAQAFAGPIVAVFGTPPPAHVVGATAFTVSKDNGHGVPDETASLSVAPPLAFVTQVLQQNLPPAAVTQILAQIGNLSTIQQLAVLLPFFGPPQFGPLLSGYIWVR